MKLIVRLSLVILLGLSSLARAADPLVITSGSDRAMPIAVVPFAWSGQQRLSEDLAQIVTIQAYLPPLRATT